MIDADTGAIVALVDADDRHHGPLRRLFESEGFRIETLKAQGRGFPLAHWLFMLEPYSSALYRLAERGARVLRLADRRISINLGDQMACLARKN